MGKFSYFLFGIWNSKPKYFAFLLQNFPLLFLIRTFPVLVQKFVICSWIPFLLLKFIYSEKTTKFCEISTVDLTITTQDKSTVEISQQFVAFSEYVNFDIVGQLDAWVGKKIQNYADVMYGWSPVERESSIGIK